MGISAASTDPAYRGRIAPSPTGFLHLGHARTFWTAWQRARNASGQCVLRIEDIDAARCKREFRDAVLEDLRWLGITWDEGPDIGGPHAPYTQSERRPFYIRAWEQLRDGGHIYPCTCSRKEIASALSAPHAGDEEPNYPGTCRPKKASIADAAIPGGVHWRFRVPEGEQLWFEDGAMGRQSAMAGRDFGDFVVWRRDDVPAYQLAVAVDDAAMRITEVVRGADLLLSTFRQLLLYRALGLTPPVFYHAPLILDPQTGQRLAKRHASLSLRELRRRGADPSALMHGNFPC